MLPLLMNRKEAGFPLVKAATGAAVVTTVARKTNEFLDGRDETAGNRNNNIVNTSNNVGTNSLNNREVGESSRAGGLRDKITETIDEKKDEKKATLTKVQTAANATYYFGMATVFGGSLTGLSGYPILGSIIASVGGLLIYGTHNAVNVATNAENIVENPRDYKSRGQWDAEKISAQLKKDTFYFDWGVDLATKQLTK